MTISFMFDVDSLERSWQRQDARHIRVAAAGREGHRQHARKMGRAAAQKAREEARAAARALKAEALS